MRSGRWLLLLLLALAQQLHHITGLGNL